MGLFKKKTASSRPSSSESTWLGDKGPDADPRLPGSAGYHGRNKGKNAMPEYRFNYVRPDQQQKR